jgi:uncharacterized RDD family membrane protein YckC
LNVAVALGCYVVCEALFGRTLGKVLSRSRVVMDSGERPPLGAILLRTLVRIVPFEPFSMFSGHGWHDRWSGTQVVSSRYTPKLTVPTPTQSRASTSTVPPAPTIPRPPR